MNAPHKTTAQTVNVALPLNVSNPAQPLDFSRNIAVEAMRMIWRRWRLMALTFAIVSSVVATMQLSQPERYVANASIMISPRHQSGPGVPGFDDNPAPTAPDSALVDSEIEFINSRVVAAEIVDQFNLMDDPEWNGALQPPSFLGGLKQQVKDVLGGGGGSYELTDAEVQQITREKVIGEAVDAIAASRAGLSYAVRISAKSASPHQAQDIANAVVDVYQANRAAAQSEGAQRANRWLSERVEKLRAELAEKEAAVEAYRNSSGLFGSEGDLLVERKLLDAQRLVLEARANLADKTARYSQIQSASSATDPAEAIPAVLTSDVIRDLRAREAELTSAQADLELRYGSQHPSVRNGRASIANVRNQITLEIDRIEAGVRTEVGVARRQLQVLEQNLEQIRREMSSDNTKLVKLRELEREANSKREVYEGLVQRQLTIEGREQYRNTNVRILQDAALPLKPSVPNVPFSLAMALSLGLGTAIFVALVAGQLDDDTLYFAEQVREKTGYPVVASIPKLTDKALGRKSSPATFVVERPLSAYAEALRVMLTSIQSDTGGVGPAPVVCTTSALPSEGKTTMSLSIARVAAMSGTKVLIIDCDTRRRTFNELFKIKPERGLLEVLSGSADWRDVVIQDKLSAAKLLPLREQTADLPTHAMGSDEFKKLLSEAKQEYELIMLDAPPVLSVAEARTIAANADQVYLVARSGQTKHPALNSAIMQLESKDVGISGIALNCVNVNAPGRLSYGDSLYYKESKEKYYVSEA